MGLHIHIHDSETLSLKKHIQVACKVELDMSAKTFIVRGLERRIKGPFDLAISYPKSGYYGFSGDLSAKQRADLNQAFFNTYSPTPDYR